MAGRRTLVIDDEPVVSRRRSLEVGTVRIDIETGCAYSGDRELDLTPLEFRLLAVLLERRGRVQTRRQLLQAAWNIEAQIETRTVDMHVARLRAKLAGAGDRLETVRGVGYLYRGPE